MCVVACAAQCLATSLLQYRSRCLHSVPYSEAQELARLWNVPLFETSALAGVNVTEAFSEIVGLRLLHGARVNCRSHAVLLRFVRFGRAG